MRGGHVSCSSSVKGELKLQSRQSDDVAEGCGGAPTEFLYSPLRSSFSTMTGRREPRDPTQPIRRACDGLSVKRLRHMRTRASLKIASVIQPGRRWDSPTKLTSPNLSAHFLRKIMGSSRWKVAAAAFLVIVGSLLPVDADEHEHTVRQRGRLKRGSRGNNGRLCNLLTVAATASRTQENTITGTTGCMARTVAFIHRHTTSY